MTRGRIIYHAYKEHLIPSNVKCTFNNKTNIFELRLTLNNSIKIDWNSEAIHISELHFNKWKLSYEHYLKTPNPHHTPSLPPTLPPTPPPLHNTPTTSTSTLNTSTWLSDDISLYHTSDDHNNISTHCPPINSSNSTTYSTYKLLKTSSHKSPLKAANTFINNTNTTTTNIPHLKSATLNVHSIRNKVDIIIEHFKDLDLDILCITETWLSTNDTPIIASLNNDIHHFVHLPRAGTNYGGGIGILYNNNIKMTNNKDLEQLHSEAFSCTFHPIYSHSFTFITIYRPPHHSIPKFIVELNNLLNTTNMHTTILGDFNIPISNNAHFSKLLNNTIESHNCIQHVNKPTHSTGNILDLIITQDTNTSITDITVNRLITDHHIVTFSIHSPKHKRQPTTIHYRQIKSINTTNFIDDLNKLLNISSDPTDITNFDMLITKTMDKHAPLITKTITKRNNIKWFSPKLSTTKRKLRAAEKIWRRSKSNDDLLLFKQQSTIYRHMIIRAKQDYYIDTIKAAGNNTKKLFEISYSLLGRATTRILPDIPLQSMPIHFDTYFNNKITNIINSLPSLTLPQITISIYKFNTFNTPTLTKYDSSLLNIPQS